MNKSNKYITQILAVNFLMLFSACTPQPEKVETEEEHHSELIELTQAQFDQAGIVTGKAVRRSIGTELKVNGIIDVPPHGKVSIHLPYGGFLKSTEMLEGTKVKKGQLLVVIENPDFIEYQQTYLESLAENAFLKAEFERHQGLFKEKVISEKDYQQAKSAFDANEVRVKISGDRLKLIGFNLTRIREGKTSASVNIYSPISGAVLEIYGNVGKYIEPRDAIMDIIDNTDLHVELSVFENDISRIKEGQKIRFSVTNIPDQVREAEVFLIGSGVREDRSVTVHGHLKKIEKDMLPGMYVSANIIIGSSKVLTVPEEAVVRFNSKHYVFLLDSKKQENNQTVYHFKMKEVIKGISEEEFVQIKYPNEADISIDEIVLEGAFTILSKSKNSDEGGHGH